MSLSVCGAYLDADLANAIVGEFINPGLGCVVKERVCEKYQSNPRMIIVPVKGAQEVNLVNHIPNVLSISLAAKSNYFTQHLNILWYTKVYGDIMEATTIKLNSDTKAELDTFREYKNESYDEVVKKIVFIAKSCKTQPKLSVETMNSIEKARARIKQGKFLTEAEARKRLGI